MSLKAKVEAIIYAAEEPVTLEQIAQLLNEAVLADLAVRERAAIEEAAQSGTDVAQPEELPSADALSIPDLSAPSPEPAESSPETGQAPAPEEGTPAAATVAEVESTDASASNSQAEPTWDASQSAPSESVPPESAGTDGQTAEAVTADPAPAASASVIASAPTSRKRKPQKSEQEIAQDKAVRTRLREVLAELVTDYASEERGMEVRQVAGGFRMATKPEHHDVVRAFAKSLKPPIRLSLAALETLAVVAYKQPITAPEIADIRGIESASVIGTLLDRKLITTAGRKQVIGRPMQYKTSKDFLLRFGLNDVNELPSMEEFSQLAADATILTSEETAAEAAPSEATTQSPSLFEPEGGEDSSVAAEQPGTPDSQGKTELTPDDGEPSSPQTESRELPESESTEVTEAESPVQEPENPEAHFEAPEPQPTETAETTNDQPQSETDEAESSKVSEAERQ